MGIRGGSNEYPQSIFLSRNVKIISEFLSENFQFLVVKVSVYLNKLVFVMSKSRVFVMSTSPVYYL